MNSRTVAITLLLFLPAFPQAVRASWDPDGSGGAILAWSDRRNGTDFDIFAQHVSSTGTLLWMAGGNPVCVAAGDQNDVNVDGDGSGGLFIAWTDTRSGAVQMYGQHLDGSGTPLGQVNGIPLSLVASDKTAPLVSAAGPGSAIACWMDYRNGNWDLYAQQISVALSGVTDAGSQRLPSRIENSPNPFRDFTEIRFQLSEPSAATIKVFDPAGRLRLSRFVSQATSGWNLVRINGTDDLGRQLPAGRYTCRVEAQGERLASTITILR